MGLPLHLRNQLNLIARGFTPDRAVYGGIEHWSGGVRLVRLTSPGRYGTCTVHRNRTLGALAHLPLVAWRAEFAMGFPSQLGARWMCQNWSTSVFFHDDATAPGTHLCRRCLAAQAELELRARRDQILGDLAGLRIAGV